MCAGLVTVWLDAAYSLHFSPSSGANCHFLGITERSVWHLACFVFEMRAKLEADPELKAFVKLEAVKEESEDHGGHG